MQGGDINSTVDRWPITQLLNYPCFTLVTENRSFILQRDQWHILHFSESPLKKTECSGNSTYGSTSGYHWLNRHPYVRKSILYLMGNWQPQTVSGNVFKTDSTADCNERLNFRKELRPFIIQQRMHKMHITRYYLCKQNVTGTIYARLLCALWFELRLLAMHWHR